MIFLFGRFTAKKIAKLPNPEPKSIIVSSFEFFAYSSIFFVQLLNLALVKYQFLKKILQLLKQLKVKKLKDKIQT